MNYADISSFFSFLLADCVHMRGFAGVEMLAGEYADIAGTAASVKLCHAPGLRIK